MADDTVRVSFLGDSSSLRRAADESDGRLSKLSASIGDFAKKAAIGFAAAGVAVGAFAKSAVSAASDLAESQGKVGVVFGAQAKDIEAWASTSARAFGQSKQSALEAVGTYGNLFQAFGIGRTESANMSKSLVELAADLASFNNTSVDDALLALRSGLSGETEPLKRFGVAINDARLKEEALRLGLIKTTKEALSPAAKAQASYALIMKDTTLAQGDFARTSDGLANKTRILKARFADIQAEIGTRLIPIVNSLAGFFLDKLLPAFEKIGTTAAGAFAAFVNAFKAGDGEITSSGLAGFMERVGYISRQVFEWLRDNVPPVLSRIGDIARDVFEQRLVPAFRTVSDIIMHQLWPAVKTVFDFLNEHREIVVGIAAAIAVGLVAAFLSWAAAAAAAAAATIVAAAPIIAIGVAIAALVAGVIYAYNHFETFREVVDAVGRFVMGVLNDVADNWREWGATVIGVVETAIGVVRTVIETVLGAIQAFWRTWGDEIVQVLSGVFTIIRGVVEGAMQFIQGVIDVFMGIIRGDWGRAWDGIKQIFESFWTAIKALVEGALGILQGVISAAMTAIAGVFDAAWDGIKTVAAEAFNWVVGEVEKVPGRIVALVGLFLKAGKDLFQGLYDGAKQIVSDLLIWVSRLPGEIVDWIGDVSHLLFNIGKQILQGLWDGMKDVWNDMTGWIGGLGSKIAGLKGPIEKDRVLLYDEGSAIIEGLGAGMSDAWDVLEPRIGALSDAIADPFAGLPDAFHELGAGIGGGLAAGIGSMSGAVGKELDGLISITREKLEEWAKTGVALLDPETGRVITDPSQIKTPPQSSPAPPDDFWNEFGAGSLQFAGSFAGGGIVPGPRGKPFAAIVHGGENIVDGPTGGTTINMVFNNLTVDSPARVQDLKFMVERRLAVALRGAVA